MPRRVEQVSPHDEDILKYSNVPVEVAAKYIGWSSVTIKNALKQERAPFGFASQNPKTGTFSYNISPGGLVKYKHGDLPAYRLKEVMNIAAVGIEDILNEKLKGLRKAVDSIIG